MNAVSKSVKYGIKVDHTYTDFIKKNSFL